MKQIYHDLLQNDQAKLKKRHTNKANFNIALAGNFTQRLKIPRTSTSVLCKKYVVFTKSQFWLYHHSTEANKIIALQL